MPTENDAKIKLREGPPISKSLSAEELQGIVDASRNPKEACAKLGYKSPTTLRRHMRWSGVKAPLEWHRRPQLGLVAQRYIPEIIIPSIEDRSWVGALLQGEGCIQSIYRKKSDSTYLELDTSMADAAPIFKLSECYGLPRPSKPTRNHQWKPLWRKNIAGLRALRVLEEALPFLVGQKLKEAERAVAFFAPRGFHRGYFRNADIWSQSGFPLRTKLRGSNELSINRSDEDRMNNPLEWSQQARIPLSNQWNVPEIIIPTLEARCWVGALIQGEGCIASHYVKATDSTTIDLAIGMTDPAPIFRLSDYVGLSRPTRPKPHPGKPTWIKRIYGPRAYRILQEVRPYLVGEKLREAEKALAFFSKDGYFRGHRKPMDIWPSSEFPLRKRNHVVGGHLI